MTSPRAPVLLVFLLFQALYALTSSGSVFRVADEFETYFQTERLVDARELAIPQTLELLAPGTDKDGRPVLQPIFFGKRGVFDKKPYAPYGPLAAFLALPHHLGARAVAAIAGIERRPLASGRAWLFVVAGLTSLATATAAAAAVAGFLRAAVALGGDVARATVLALLLGGASVLWPYGTCFYSEAFLAALLVWATAFLLEAREASAPRERVAAAAGLLLVAGLTKATALVLLPPFVVAALLDAKLDARARSRTAAVLFLSAFVAGALHGAWNLRRFGSAFDFGYSWKETIAAHEAPRAFALDELPRGLFVLLLSPGKSLFLWAPCLVLAAARARAFARAERALAIGLGVALGTALVFYGSYMFVEGGYCHGPRHLVPLVPLLLLPAATPGTPEPSRRALVACAVAGGILALLSVSISFVGDQTLGDDLAHPRPGVYERITPAPGRPWNRYRLGWIPFARTLTQSTPEVPDFFPVTLARARPRLPDGASIPVALPWLLPLPWLVLLAAATARIVRDRNRFRTLPPQESEIGEGR